MSCFLVTKSHPSSPLSGHLLIIIFCFFALSKVYPVYNLQIQSHHHHWIQPVFLSHNLAIIVVILIFLSACKQLLSSSLCYCVPLPIPQGAGKKAKAKVVFTISHRHHHHHRWRHADIISALLFLLQNYVFCEHGSHGHKPYITQRIVAVNFYHNGIFQDIGFCMPANIVYRKYFESEKNLHKH